MKKILVFVIICFISYQLIGQSVGVSAGLNRNQFYYPGKQDIHTSATYNYDYGYSMGISIEDLKLDSLSIKLTLEFFNYNGKIHTESSGLGAGSSTSAQVSKNIIGIGIYPYQLRLFQKVKILFGGEMNVLMSNKTSGTMYSWRMTDNHQYEFSERAIKNINGNLNFGLSSQVCYSIKLLNNWVIVPEYQFYLGLSNEFKNIELPTKSFRHYFKLGLTKKL